MTGPQTPDANSNDTRIERSFWLQRLFSQLRIKITLPYALLALAVAFTAAFLVTRLLASLLEDRFETALLDAGRMATDTVVWVEREQLAVWRSIAYTEGFAEAVAEEDGSRITRLASPHLINAQLDCLEVVDRTGTPLLAMHHTPDGALTDYDTTPGRSYGDWQIVQQVLAGEVDEVGDKYADLIETDWGWVFYTAGPIKQEGEVIGVLLVGTYLEDLVERLSAGSLARVSVYGSAGPPLETSLAPEEPARLTLDAGTYRRVLEEQHEWVHRRDVEVAERAYAEVFGAFEARYGRDMGVLSVALPLSFVTDAGNPTREYLLGLFGLATVLVILTGALVANAVVRRVRKLATATQQVAQGDLDTQVEMAGHDEVATLARDFNYMVNQLREGQLYRDLLGLTTSPEVAERLREGIRRGKLQLEAQSVIATVLFVDIRGFTAMAERQDPVEVISFLNEYLQGLIAIIREHDGVINKFAGDAALAFFGVLPEICPPAQSARDALAAAMMVQFYVDEFNQRREEGQEPLRVGIGVNTGLVVVGTVGSKERLEYTLIGDAVNVAQRLSDLNKEYPEYDLFVGPETYRLMGDDLQTRAKHLGTITVKGRVTPLNVYVVEE